MKNARPPSEALMTLALLMVACFSSAQGADPRQIAERTFPSIVMVVMEDANRQPLSQGSGFFVKKGVIATNLHVIEGANSGYAKLIGRKEKLDILGTVGIDEALDLALLSVREAGAPSLVLGDSMSIVVGDEVYAVGNPQGLEGTFSRGIVSGIRYVGSDTLLQITAPISPGSSGGPILDEQGKVVGIAVATFRNGQNLNFAVPVSYLKNILKNPGAVSALSSRSRRENQNSILDNLGKPSVEGVRGEKFAWDEYYQSGDFSFSLRNMLRERVRRVSYVIVFYDGLGDPIDVRIGAHYATIPGGLAKRVSDKVDETVEKMNSPYRKHEVPPDPRSPINKVEIRILAFEIIGGGIGEKTHFTISLRGSGFIEAPIETKYETLWNAVREAYPHISSEEFLAAWNARTFQ